MKLEYRLLCSVISAAIVVLPATFGRADDAGQHQAAPKLARTIPLPGVGVPKSTGDGSAIPGRLDHLAYDPATGRLFVAALQQGSLEVVDLNQGKRIKRITGLGKPQGIAVVSSAGCVVVACGDENAVHVYSLADLKQRAVTTVGQDADNVRCDGTNRVFVGFGRNIGGGLAVYDAHAMRKVTDIWLGSHPESFQFDLRPGQSRMFVNLPGQKRATNDGGVAAIDRSTGRRLAMWPLTGAAQNFPMAFDSVHDRVYIASRKPPQVIALDGKTGTEISRAPCVADSDDLFYDAATDRVLVIGGGHRTGDAAPPGASHPGDDAALEVFQADGHGKLAKIASVATAPHARTGYFAPERRAIYVVCPPHGGEDAKILEFLVGN